MKKALYDLFELAGEVNSRLVLIGIANGLDMLERVLPNLSKNNKPKQLNFQPYKTEQIETLIKVRITNHINRHKQSLIFAHKINLNFRLFYAE